LNHSVGTADVCATRSGNVRELRVIQRCRVGYHDIAPQKHTVC
jgi:hypothetical protein